LTDKNKTPAREGKGLAKLGLTWKNIGKLLSGAGFANQVVDNFSTNQAPCKADAECSNITSANNPAPAAEGDPESK
jgi:hypothetical protein